MFSQQEEEISNLESAIKDMHSKLYDISLGPRCAPRPIIPLSAIGVRHDDSMYFMSWDWDLYFRHTINLLIRVKDKFPEVIRKRFDAIRGKVINEMRFKQALNVMPFMFPIYYNGSLHFLWSEFIDRFVSWLNTYLFLKEEGLRTPNKNNLAIMQGNELIIGQDWHRYLISANEYLRLTLIGYSAIYHAIILDYEISVLGVKAQIKLRKNWIADLYVKKLFGGDSMKSILTSLSNYDSESILQGIIKGKDALNKKPKLDTSSLKDAIDNMKEMFNWQEDLGSKDDIEAASKNYDDALDDLQDSLDNMETHIEDDSKNIKQEVQKLSGDAEIATLSGNFSDPQVQWETVGIAEKKKEFVKIEARQKAAKVLYENFIEVLDIQLDKIVGDAGFKSFAELESKARSAIGSDKEVDALIEQLDAENEDQLKFLQGKGNELKLPEDSRAMVRDLSTQAGYLASNTTALEDSHSDFLKNAKAKINNDFKAIIERIKDAIDDLKGGYICIFPYITFEQTRVHDFGLFVSLRDTLRELELIKSPNKQKIANADYNVKGEFFHIDTQLSPRITIWIIFGYVYHFSAGKKSTFASYLALDREKFKEKLQAIDIKVSDTLNVIKAFRLVLKTVKHYTNNLSEKLDAFYNEFYKDSIMEETEPWLYNLESWYEQHKDVLKSKKA